MTHNKSFFQNLVSELIRAKKSNYSEQCFNYYIDESKFLIEDISGVENQHHQKLKCTLIKHRTPINNRHTDSQINSKCIIYLHGLGSSRLESLAIAPQLPKSYCLCLFDLSGSGKSEGEFITYGLKEKDDIQPVISYLNSKKFIREFVIWGRSMGAVATLLYGIQLSKNGFAGQKRTSTTYNSLKNSINYSLQASLVSRHQSLIKCLVIDSPFHNFRDIAKQISTKKLAIPNFILDIAINYVDNAFNKILYDSEFKENYNPFLINFSEEINLTMPVIFMYSEKDEVVPPSHSERIIKNIKSKFQKFFINQCTHNQPRPDHIIKDIFLKIDMFRKRNSHEKRRLSQSISKELNSTQSVEKKRGIFVFTPSKQMKKTIETGPKSLKFYETISHEQNFIDIIKTEESNSFHKNVKRLSQNRKTSINLSSSRKKNGKEQDKYFVKSTIRGTLNTIDVETNILINKKLLESREGDLQTLSKLNRPRRFNLQRRRQLKLTHDRYLE